MTALLEFPEILCINACQRARRIVKKLRISFRIIHLMHVTQEVHIREMTLAGSRTVLT